MYVDRSRPNSAEIPLIPIDDTYEMMYVKIQITVHYTYDISIIL